MIKQKQHNPLKAKHPTSTKEQSKKENQPIISLRKIGYIRILTPTTSPPSLSFKAPLMMPPNHTLRENLATTWPYNQSAESRISQIPYKTDHSPVH